MVPPETERAEQERHYPLITQKESSFIETTGGEYTGYVDGADGRTFTEFWADRRAYYDPDRRQVVVRFIATDAVNDIGNEELAGPSEVFGFSTIVSTESQSGIEELEELQIIQIQPNNFAEAMPVAKMRDLARELHTFLASNASKVSGQELRARAEEMLAKHSWHKERSADG